MFITHEPCPEAYDIFKRFAKVFEQTYTRFLDLQKAEAQAREAQIEAALEKVRSRSLAMHKSEELGEVITVVVEKLKELDFSVDDGVALITFTEGSKDLTEWMENPGFISAINFHLPYFNHPVLNVLWEAKEKGEEFLYTRFNAEENKSFLNHIFEYSDFKHTPQDVKEFCLAAETYATSIALQKNTGIFINDYSGKSLTAKEIDILKRFSKVFEQTYTRFLDLQKAEAQGREAQIELALERVRARSMAMQSSDELVQASDVMYEELSKLDIKTIRIGICTMDAKTGAAEVWSRAEKDKRSGNHILGVVPKGTHPVFDNMVKAWKANKPFYSNTRTGGEVREYYEKLAEHLSYPLSKKYNDKETITTFFFREGSLNVVSTDPLQEADSGVMLRFAKVFEQTYTRFLDLQKAEAQARESQIQLALERVRARSMAMHKSEELAALSFELVKQIQALGVATWFCAFNIYDEDQKGSLEWGSNAEGTYPSYRTPREGIFLRYYEAGQNGETLLINEIGEDECPAHYEYLCSLPGVGEQLLKMRDSGISFPNSQIDHVAYFKYGYIIFITFEPVPEAHDIFKRFAKIFEQTYTRFLDLQKAEEQAKVAVKQASLDRVRGEIASMRSAQDLERITPLIWNELNILGIPFIRCGVFIVHEKKENVEVYLSSSKGQSLAVLHLPFGSNDLTIQSVDAWRKGKVYIQHWNKEDFLNWSKSMMAQGQIQDQETYQGTNAPPESLDLHFVPFTQGMLYVGSPYSLNEEEIDLVKSLAEAFEIAYARYEDFVKLEKAKESIEVTLNELKATQAQLIQSEKLASLGQLTAGIAHEIKNPLNFVNNFSDLSIDLIEEVFEELDKTKDQENNEEIRELLTVVKSNLEKIHQHGTRADGIVKSMLQHSRGGNGKMELTDLNILVKEYVNLSFHGMRASKNPINVSLKFDLDTQLSPVKLISEEFSRVVLNLCNNAFDAMREKTKTDKNYQPVLTLKTEEIENHILLSVADNGPGIPEGIKDKILQPFFTTKKGTEGTGLGLSLSYDIVKTHGAELKVETKLGDGTEFMILLPI
jgi:signal transduction histidine kinase